MMAGHLVAHYTQWNSLNTLRPRQNGGHLADDTFKRIFLNENVRISIKISLRFVPKGPINNNASLVQIMARRPSGDKPLPEPMIVSLLTHICVTRPQWVISKFNQVTRINLKVKHAGHYRQASVFYMDGYFRSFIFIKFHSGVRDEKVTIIPKF